MWIMRGVKKIIYFILIYFYFILSFFFLNKKVWSQHTILIVRYIVPYSFFYSGFSCSLELSKFIACMRFYVCLTGNPTGKETCIFNNAYLFCESAHIFDPFSHNCKQQY